MDLSQTFTKAVKKRIASRSITLGETDQKKIFDEIDSSKREKVEAKT